MPRSSRRVLLPVVVALLVASPVAGQQTRDPIEGLRPAIERAKGQPDDSDAVVKLDAEIQRLTDLSTELTQKQYLWAGQLLLRSGMAARSWRIADRALEQFEDDAELCAMLGLAEFAWCQDVDNDEQMRQHAAAAVVAFARARKGSAAIPAAYLVPWQACLIDCRFDAALEELDRVGKDERFAAQLPDRHLARGMVLLGAGRYGEALAELDHEELDAETRASTAQMAIRAMAMTGETKQAVERAKQLWEQQPTPTSMAFYADTLGADQQYDAALAFLAAHPVEALPREPDTHLAQRRQSRAAFEYLLGLRGKAEKQLFLALAQQLGHKAVSVPDDASLSASPLFLGYVVRKAPTSPKGWANDLLFLLCVIEAEAYQPGEMEAKVLAAMFDDATRQALTGEGARERALQILRGTLLREDFEGALTSLRLAAEMFVEQDK